MERENKGKMKRKKNTKSTGTFQEIPPWITKHRNLLVELFNITYYSVFQNIRNILQELHKLFAPDKNI